MVAIGTAKPLPADEQSPSTPDAGHISDGGLAAAAALRSTVAGDPAWRVLLTELLSPSCDAGLLTSIADVLFNLSSDANALERVLKSNTVVRLVQAVCALATTSVASLKVSRRHLPVALHFVIIQLAIHASWLCVSAEMIFVSTLT